MEGEDGVSCPGCGRTWPVREGIVSFVEGYPYWGEFPREELVQLIEKAKETGWREAVSAAFQDQVAWEMGWARFLASLPLALLLALGWAEVVLPIAGGRRLPWGWGK